MDNLPYLQFSDEVEKIRRASYLRIDSLESAKEKFPQLYKKLRLSGACAAALYPIEGINSEGSIEPVGMIVVMYDEPKRYYLGYYNECIAPYIQVLSTLLNYNTMYKNKQ